MTADNWPPAETLAESVHPDSTGVADARDSETSNYANSQQQYPEELLLADLQRVAQLVEGDLTEREYTNYGQYGVTTYRRRFGSWNDAKKAADLGTIRRAEVPKDRLITDLKRVGQQLDGPLSEREYSERGSFGVSTYRRRFGSWNAAKREAGLAVRERSDLSEEALANELARLVDEIDQEYVTPSIYEERSRYCLADLPDDDSFWEDMLDRIGLQITPLYNKFTTDSAKDSFLRD